MTRQIAIMLIALCLGGCASHGAATDTGQDDHAYRTRQMCQDTAIGSDSKRVCY